MEELRKLYSAMITETWREAQEEKNAYGTPIPQEILDKVEALKEQYRKEKLMLCENQK